MNAETCCQLNRTRNTQHYASPPSASNCCVCLGTEPHQSNPGSDSETPPHLTQPQRGPPDLPSTSHLRPFLIMALVTVPTALPPTGKTGVAVFIRSLFVSGAAPSLLSVVPKLHSLIKSPVLQSRRGGPGASVQMTRAQSPEDGDCKPLY